MCTALVFAESIPICQLSGSCLIHHWPVSLPSVARILANVALAQPLPLQGTGASCMPVMRCCKEKCTCTANLGPMR